MFAGLKFLGTKIPEVSITHMTHLHNLLAATKRKHSLSMAHNILLQAGAMLKCVRMAALCTVQRSLIMKDAFTMTHTN